MSFHQCFVHIFPFFYLGSYIIFAVTASLNKAFMTWALNGEVNGQLHAPAALPLEKLTPLSIGYAMAGLPKLVWTQWKREKNCSCHESNPDSPIIQSGDWSLYWVFCVCSRTRGSLPCMIQGIFWSTEGHLDSREEPVYLMRAGWQLCCACTDISSRACRSLSLPGA